MAHLNFNSPHFNCSIAAHSQWLQYWTAGTRSLVSRAGLSVYGKNVGVNVSFLLSDDDNDNNGSVMIMADSPDIFFVRYAQKKVHRIFWSFQILRDHKT